MRMTWSRSPYGDSPLFESEDVAREIHDGRSAQRQLGHVRMRLQQQEGEPICIEIGSCRERSKWQSLVIACDLLPRSHDMTVRTPAFRKDLALVHIDREGGSLREEQESGDQQRFCRNLI